MLQSARWKVALVTGVFALFAGEVSAQGRPGGGGGGGQCNKGGSSTSQLQSRSMPNTQAANTALYSQYAVMSQFASRCP